ncbi:TPA: DUF596 domain-containing protein [Escherichia coli]
MSIKNDGHYFCRAGGNRPDGLNEPVTIFEHLLKEGRIKLAKHGKFLEGSVDEQVERFRRAFPKTEEEMEDGIWFFDESCPGGAVWVLEDGSLEWT